MRNSSEYELRLLHELNQRAADLVKSTSVAIDYTHERVRYGMQRVSRVRMMGFGSKVITLRPPRNPPSLIDAQVFDDPDDAAMLNEVADSCTVCGSRSASLVALVRFESLGLDLALCGECYQSLSDRALGQVM